jgi:hypothetical protein
MRASQWNVLGWASYLLMGFFLWWWRMESFSCRSSDIFAPVNRLDITNCVTSEVLGIIIPIFIVLGAALFICGSIEANKEKQKERKRKAKRFLGS